MIKLLLFLLLLATALSQGAAEVFRVTPDTSATHLHCPPPCYTLDQYASNHSLLEGHTNITLIFLRGEHTLNHDLLVSGVDELSMQTQETAVSDNEVVITSESEVQTRLEVSAFLKIEGIALRHQPNLQIVGPTQRVLLARLTLDRVMLSVQQAQLMHIKECNGSLSTLQLHETVDVSVTKVKFSGAGQYSGYTGIQITSQDTNINGSLVVQNSQFLDLFYGLRINADMSQVTIITNTTFARNLAGVFLSGLRKEMKITDSKFIDNDQGIRLATFGGMQVTKTNVLTVLSTTFENNFRGILVRQSQNEITTITNSLLEGNVNGVTIFASQGDIQITGTNFLKNLFGVYTPSSNNVRLLILNSAISYSTNIGLYLIGIPNVTISDSYITINQVSITSIDSTLIIQDTLIGNNSFGVVVPPDNQAKNTFTLIQNCTFASNFLSGLTLTNVRGAVELKDCSFNRNEGTPLIAYQSRFELMGETVFRDNTADRGGGLALYNSTVTFGPGSNTQFINNTALEYGGAIYVASLPSILFDILIDFESSNFGIDLFQQICFFSFSAPSTSTRVTFTENNAALGGLDIYGPTLYTSDCSISNNIFSFSDKEPSTLQVASEPSRVCFCIDDVPQCENKSLLVINERRYPGEHFSVPVVLTGYNFGRVAGSVYTNAVGQDYKEVIDESQHVQTVNLLNCTRLIYAVSSYDQEQTEDSVLLALTAQDQIKSKIKDFESSQGDISSQRCTYQPPCTALLTTPIFISVTLEECPLGFELNTATGMCDCDQTLGSFIHNDGTPLNCELQNRFGYISREGTVWIGVDTNQNNTGLYYLYRNCPRDYCNVSEMEVDLRNPNIQCGLNRGGVMCGSCYGNTSLQLGSNSCVQCSNVTIVLSLIFAILGILLVVLITTLDLTVASGTINGLIFYANVVWRNNAILFSSQITTTRNYYQIITVPIAWINLDFGIETCFSESLDQLTKTGLQFVFPVYIWCIAGLIIIISHYSTRATKLFGRNSVAVLATLFLLSYGKLFRGMTDVFSFADMTDSNGTWRKVWYLDGNVHYGKSEHIILITVALVFLFFFLLPFTLLLLIVPFLRAKSNLRPLRWINKIIPILDTYTGPFKHKKRYQVWTGILLVARMMILITFASVPPNDSYINILLMIVVSTVLLAYVMIVGLPYKKYYVSLLEVSYLFNLALLGGVFLFSHTPPRINRMDDRPTNPGPIISVWIVLFQLAGTVIFHTVRRILLVKKIQTCLKPEVKKPVEMALDANKPKPTGQVIDANAVYDSSRFRETLFI